MVRVRFGFLWGLGVASVSLIYKYVVGLWGIAHLRACVVAFVRVAGVARITTLAKASAGVTTRANTTADLAIIAHRTRLGAVGAEVVGVT